MTAQYPKVSLADLLLGCARAYGERTALSDELRRLSFRQLSQQSAQLAHVLRSEGVSPGDQVGVALRDSIDVMLTMMALWMLDAVVVQLDFRSRVDDRNRLAVAFDLASVVEDRTLPGAGYRQINLRDCQSRASTRPLVPPGELTAETYPALISLTSGTTGEPIGMVTSHRALVVRYVTYGLEVPYPHDSRFLNAFPLSFSASRNHTFGNLIRGNEIIFHPPTFGASELIEKTNSLDVGFLFAVPATVRDMLDVVGPVSTPALPTLKTLYCGGSHMPSTDKLAAVRDLTPCFSHCFSSTTTGTVSILSGADLLTHTDTEGKILPTVRAEVVDGDGTPVPPGEIGALRVRSPGAVDNIYKDRDRASGDRIRDGWGYTGDLGIIDRDGFLTIKGRTSDMIIRGGANVYPAEVETVMSTLPGVKEVAVTGFANRALGEEIAAFVVADPSVTEGMLVAHCRTKLQPDKRPRRFVFLEALPRNANGKVLKRELRQSIEEEWASTPTTT
jgi:acyl-CoA synthetase (AMP-forming)/AMP-acid ligase II